MSPYIIDIFYFKGGNMNSEIKFFEDYVRDYDMNNSEIKHKYKHTYRVVGYAKELAKSLDLDEKEFNRASICALFHDIGRFPQLKKYNTYTDGISFDHGDKGYEILKESNYNDDIVLKAVKYHNKKDVPEFDELTNLHCKLVRDADKLDIMIALTNEDFNERYKISEEALNCFKNHEQVNNQIDDTDFNDFLKSLGFVFDINFKRTIEILFENNIIEKKLNILKESIDIKDYLIIEKEIKEYIKERFDIIC